MVKAAGNRQGGQSLLETALALPVVLLVLLGIFDLSRAVYYQSVIANGAREGARYGSVPSHEGDQAGVINAAQATMVGLEPGNVQIVVNWLEEEMEAEIIQVQVRYRMTVITPLIADVVGDGGQLNLVSESTMRIDEDE